MYQRLIQATGIHKMQIPSFELSSTNQVISQVNSLIDNTVSQVNLPEFTPSIEGMLPELNLNLDNMPFSPVSLLDNLGPLGSTLAGVSTNESDTSTEWCLCLPDGSIINFTSILSIDVDSSNKVMQSPVEQGAFVMYNKGVTPTTVDLVAAVQGDDAKRQYITQLLLNLSGTNDLLTLITPEMEFSGYNLESVQYSRKPDDGVDVIYFDISLIEVRQVTQQYTNAKLAKKNSKGKQNGSQSALSGLKDYIF